MVANWRFNPIGVSFAMFGDGFFIFLDFDGYLQLPIPLIMEFLPHVNI